jgi:hypothetical protein
MQIPIELTATTIGAALTFLFTELSAILKERRERSKGAGPEVQAGSEDAVQPQRQPERSRRRKTASTADLFQKAMQTRLQAQTEREIQSQLELIEIYKNNRRTALKQIALQGGYAFAYPPQLALLEQSEHKLVESAGELKRLVEQAYGVKIDDEIMG